MTSTPSQKFLSNTKQEQYYKVRYACEFNKFLNSSKTELDNIHKVYAENYDERDVENQDVRWKTVILLKDVINLFEEHAPIIRFIKCARAVAISNGMHQNDADSFTRYTRINMIGYERY